MEKMKDVCKKTGLSERAVRLYVKEGLIHPRTEERMNRNAYYFSESDIERLKDIAVLRNAGFSIRDIRRMQQQPEYLPTMIEERQASLETEICEKKVLQSALGRLTEIERGTSQGLAEGLRPVIEHKEAAKTKHNSKRLKYLIVITSCFILLLLFQYIKYGAYMVFVVCASLAGVLGSISLFMAMRYYTVNSRAKAMPMHGKGYIAGIVQNDGIDISYVRAGGGEAGTREPGIGGIWVLLMMVWNEIRPDNWYPIIQYLPEYKDDEIQVTTFLYGAFKNTWEEGMTVEIAWNPQKPEIALPMEAVWMRKKARFYALAGAVLCALAVGVWCVFFMQ